MTDVRCPISARQPRQYIWVLDCASAECCTAIHSPSSGVPSEPCKREHADTTYKFLWDVFAGRLANIDAVDCLTCTKASKLHGSVRSSTFVNNENSAQSCQCNGKRSVPLDSREQHKRRVPVKREILADCVICPSESMLSR